jgi:hypothetical protein
VIGGMAAGALLTYLLEQGRIDWGQYNYFNSLDQDQMIHELMQQNIIQQDEIMDLQRRLDSGDFANNDFGPDGNSWNDGALHDGFHRDEFPRDNNYGGYDSHGDDTYSNVDYDNNDFGGNDYSDNGPDGGWV